MEPFVESAVATLEQLRADLKAGLEGQSADALNWQPLPGANSIAGMVAHLLESGNYLVQYGLGKTIPREREAQFAVTVPDAAALLARIDAGFEPILQNAHCYTEIDLQRVHEFRGERHPGAWFLLRACIHMTEHWGQIQLTRDLLATRQG